MAELNELELEAVAGGASPYFGYKVASGDTLSALALRFNTNVRELMRLNNLHDANRIKAGQTLIIPRG